MDSRQLNMLLIGGNGFLGHGLQRELINRGIKYSVFDKSLNISQDLLVYNPENMSYFKDITNIVILASNIGIDLFNDNPIKYGLENIRIIENTYKLIVDSAKLYNQTYDITFYSTSEVYQNNTYITVDYSIARSLYAQSKLLGETIFTELNKKHPEICKSLKILRPFNISGRGQKRGVVYKMLYDAFNYCIITYSEDTYRLITDIDYASKESVDIILSDQNIIKNIANADIYLSMHELALFIKAILEENFNLSNITLVKAQQDKYIQTRSITNDNKNKQFDSELTKDYLTNIVLGICYDNRNWFK